MAARGSRIMGMQPDPCRNLAVVVGIVNDVGCTPDPSRSSRRCGTPHSIVAAVRPDPLESKAGVEPLGADVLLIDVQFDREASAFTLPQNGVDHRRTGTTALPVGVDLQACDLQVAVGAHHPESADLPIVQQDHIGDAVGNLTARLLQRVVPEVVCHAGVVGYRTENIDDVLDVCRRDGPIGSQHSSSRPSNGSPSPPDLLTGQAACGVDQAS